MAVKGNIAFFIPHLGCSHRCSFCNQNSISGYEEAPSPLQVKQHCRQVYHQLSPKQRKGFEVAFFGGSFTCLPKGLMVQYLEAVSEFCGQDGFYGVRISTRPDAVDEDTVCLLRQYRVTAVELGAQSMNDRVLSKNLRGHTAAQTRQSSQIILQAGMELGLQMMIGLAGDSLQGSLQTAKMFKELHPKSVRIYPVVVLKGTLLAKWYGEGSYSPLTLCEAINECVPLLPYFKQNGVKILRVGLHAQSGLEQSILAGAYHPAFHELCESRIFFNRQCELLGGKPPGVYWFAVHPKDCSKFIGHSKQNITAWRRKGYLLKLRQDKCCKQGEIVLL